MILCKTVTKIFYGNSEKSFLECEKSGFKKHLPVIFLREFFHVCISNQNGKQSTTEYNQRYWIIPRNPSGSLTNYVRLSLDVNWRFVNLNYSFKHVFGPSNRSLFVYSDVGGSSVLGEQVTDFIREVNYKREGKGTYYFEPTHLQYIPLRKELLDIIQVQVAKSTSDLTTFGQGVTTVTFHFKKI